MVHDRSHLLDVRINLELSLEPGEAVGEFIIRVGDLDFLDAQGLSLVADDLDTGLAVGAEESEASGKDNDGITANEVPSAGSISDIVEVSSPVLISNARSTESDNSDILEDVLLNDIDVADASETTSKTNAGDVQEGGTSLLLDLSEVTIDILADGSPHVVVGLLNFAVFAGSFVNDLS